MLSNLSWNIWEEHFFSFLIQKKIITSLKVWVLSRRSLRTTLLQIQACKKQSGFWGKTKYITSNKYFACLLSRYAITWYLVYFCYTYPTCPSQQLYLYTTYFSFSKYCYNPKKLLTSTKISRNLLMQYHKI